MTTSASFGAVVFLACHKADSSDPLNLLPALIRPAAVGGTDTETVGNSAKYWASRWGMPDGYSLIYSVRLELGEYSGKDGLSLLSNFSALVWHYAPLFRDAPRYVHRTRSTSWEDKRLAVGVQEGGTLPFPTRRDYLRRFPQPRSIRRRKGARA